MKYLLAAFCISLFSVLKIHAQISPPGLGETKSAMWSAIGVKQKLDEKNSLTTYIGTGRISGQEESNPFSYPSIWVINQEFSHKFAPKWKYSAALSYRRQNEYEENFDEPSIIKQEFRLYGKLNYSLSFGKFKWANTLRQEVRKFYDADFAVVPHDFQLRTRLKTQLFFSLDSDSENRLMCSAEALFSIAEDNRQGWSSLKYKDSRFCFYYTYAPNNLPLVFDIGYMNDHIGNGSHIENVSYLAFDIIVVNPYKYFLNDNN